MNNEIKRILADAPEGATHFNHKDEYKYWKLTYINGYQAFTHTTKALVNRMPEKLWTIRSLADIEKLIEMHEQQNQIKADAVSDFCFAWRNSRDVGFTEFSSKYIDKLERGDI